MTFGPAPLIKEGLWNLIPRMKARTDRGRKLSIHTKELGGPRKEKRRKIQRKKMR